MTILDCMCSSMITCVYQASVASAIMGSSLCQLLLKMFQPYTTETSGWYFKYDMCISDPILHMEDGVMHALTCEVIT